MRLIVDCDPGVDDLVALCLALAEPRAELVLVSAVAGNQALAVTERNARAILAFFGREDVPVARGCDRPLVRELVAAADVHGETGLGHARLPEPTRPPLSEHAVLALRERLLASPEPVTLVATGPLTNIALLLRLAPEVKAKIGRLVAMGGAIGLGNVTPAAEFNVYVDPEAARIVLRSGVPVTLIGLEVADQAQLDDRELEGLRALGRAGELCYQALSFYRDVHRERGFAGVPLYDPTAMAEALWPGMVRTEAMAVEVELGTGLCAGRTLCDRHRRDPTWPLVEVGVGIDAAAFKARLREALAALG